MKTPEYNPAIKCPRCKRKSLFINKQTIYKARLASGGWENMRDTEYRCDHCGHKVSFHECSPDAALFQRPNPEPDYEIPNNDE